jgi:hypothetical protein
VSLVSATYLLAWPATVEPALTSASGLTGTGVAVTVHFLSSARLALSASMARAERNRKNRRSA